MIKEIYKNQFPVFKIEAVMSVFTILVALILANAIFFGLTCKRAIAYITL